MSESLYASEHSKPCLHRFLLHPLSGAAVTKIQDILGLRNSDFYDSC